MTVPVRFRKSRDIIPNFDFIDFTSGRGYVTFDAMRTSGADILTADQLHSHSSKEYVGGNTVAHDVDFDIKFSRTVIIEGDTILVMPCSTDSPSGGTPSVTFTGSISTYDGSTETFIASGATIIADLLTAGANAQKIFSYKFDTPRTVLKKGDKLRLSLACTAAGGSDRAWIMTDPANRTSVPYGSSDLWDTARTRLSVPFVINL